VSFVSEILKIKGRDVWSVSPDTTIVDAVKLMSEKQVGALLVMEGHKLAGIVTERDYVLKVILEGKSSRQTPVREVMTTRVLCVSPERTVQECMALMTDKRARHLPVVDDERVVGVVSIGDLVKATIEEQQVLIDHLQHYING
jgi:CBS domain-containing protein